MRVLKKSIWPYQLKYNPEDFPEISLWCDVNIGKQFEDWFTYCRANTYIIAFKREDDSLAFRLKWSYNGNQNSI